jgi:hypothetical protein
MFLNRLRAFLRLFASTGIPFLLLAILLWGLKEGWGWVSLEMQFLGYKGSVAALGPDPRLPVVGITFPPFAGDGHGHSGTIPTGVADCPGLSGAGLGVAAVAPFAGGGGVALAVGPVDDGAADFDLDVAAQPCLDSHSRVGWG